MRTKSKCPSWVCQRRSNFASGGRSKSASAERARRPPISGAFWLFWLHSMVLELRLGLASDFAGDLHSARRWFELTTAHAPAVGAAASTLTGYDVSAFGIGYAGVVAMHEGCFEEAARCFAQSLEQARARRAIEVQS